MDSEDKMRSAPATFPRRIIARGLARDVGIPVVVYYVLHLNGVNDRIALLSATLVAGARVVWDAVRARTLNPFSLLIMIMFGLGLALTFATGDPRFLLLKDSITTAVLGGAFLLAALLGRPLTISALQAWQPAHAEVMAQRFQSAPLTRHRHLLTSAVWGVGLLIEAVVRVPLIYLLPIQVMVGLSALLMIGTLGALILWTGWYVRRSQRSTHDALQLPDRRRAWLGGTDRATLLRTVLDGRTWPTLRT